MINLIDVILGFNLDEKRSSAVPLAGVPAPVGEPRAQHVLRYRVGTVPLPAKFKDYRVSLSTCSTAGGLFHFKRTGKWGQNRTKKDMRMEQKTEQKGHKSCKKRNLFFIKHDMVVL